MNQIDCAVLFADLDGYTALTEAHGTSRSAGSSSTPSTPSIAIPP